jgi:hypothetical protein
MTRLDHAPFRTTRLPDHAAMILDVWSLSGIKSKITTDDLGPEETGYV